MVHSRRVTVAAGPAPGFEVPGDVSMSARRTANKASDRVRHQVADWRRSSAMASRVRLRYPARKLAASSSAT